jgi:DNA repair protein RecO (recombination protein O)
MHIEAIVIRKQPTREHDQLVTLYSRELGKLTALARGSLRFRSKQSYALDEANRVHCELVSGRSFPIMTGTQTARCLSRAKRDPLAWAAVQFFLQVVDCAVFDHQPDERLWTSLTGILERFDVGIDGIPESFRLGQRELLAALGYGQSADDSGGRWIRCGLDERFEALAQRRLSSLDLLYDVAQTSLS